MKKVTNGHYLHDFILPCNAFTYVTFALVSYCICINFSHWHRSQSRLYCFSFSHLYWFHIMFTFILLRFHWFDHVVITIISIILLFVPYYIHIDNEISTSNINKLLLYALHAHSLFFFPSSLHALSSLSPTLPYLF